MTQRPLTPGEFLLCLALCCLSALAVLALYAQFPV
jgi:hypothetical protein